MTITWPSPHTAAMLRTALNLEPHTRVLTSTRTRLPLCDYSGHPAHIEVAVYAPDHYDNRHTTLDHLAEAITDLTDTLDPDTIEVTVHASFAHQLLTRQAAA